MFPKLPRVKIGPGSERHLEAHPAASELELCCSGWVLEKTNNEALEGHKTQPC